ncbi:MAG: MobQ family relaxase [Cyanobacteriota bacterium]
MAIYHYSAKILSRGQGYNAIAAAAYRAGVALRDRQTGEIYDYSRKTKVAYTEILLPTKAPPWFLDREELWNAVEASEKRRDSQVAREINVALPKELPLEDCLELLRGFCREQYVEQGMVADLAVHWLDKNPHAHILLTTRSLDLNTGRFGQKNRDWNRKDLLEQQRKAWATHVNRALARAGKDARIDCRSFEDQGVYRVGQIHLGRYAARLLRRGGTAADHPRLERYFEIENLNTALARLEAEIAADEWRLAAGQEIREVADFVLAVAQHDRVEGDRFCLTDDAVQTGDGRRLLAGRGEALEVSDDLQEADLEFFRFQRRRVQVWLAQRTQIQRRLEGGGEEKDAGR